MLRPGPAKVMTSPISTGKLAGTLALVLSAATFVPSLACGTTAQRAHSGAQDRAHPAIVGGTIAPADTFPYVAEVIDQLGRQEVGLCTGTVVAPTLILTAGHCAENLRTGIPNAAAGYRVMTEGAGGSQAEGQISAVSGVIVYEGFRRRVDAGDAALLVLSTPTTAPAIALASSDAGALRAGATATIAGFGDTSFGQRGPTRALHRATTVVQGDRWCKRNAPPFYASEEICTIDAPSYATGVCFGDSGGPLLSTSDSGGEPVEIGISVHVYGRCSTRHPSVFTRVDRIAAWVDSWIAAYRSPPSPPAA
jgi:secreted trypsin-like serine protease